MTDTVLSSTLTAAALRLGEWLPAATELVPGPLSTGDHSWPDNPRVVRLDLGGGNALVVAVNADAATVLETGPPEQPLPAALAAAVRRVADGFEALVDGPLELGGGTELEASALADGRALAGAGAASVPLFDGDVHRATVAVVAELNGRVLETARRAHSVAHEAATPAQGTGAQVLAGQQPGPARGAAAVHDEDDGPLPAAESPQFAAFDEVEGSGGGPHPLTLLSDVTMGVTAELGRTSLTVREVLGLTPGAIIELDRAAGSPVDVIVNGTMIARGEVVVIDEEFGIRITEIVGSDNSSPARLAQ